MTKRYSNYNHSMTFEEEKEIEAMEDSNNNLDAAIKTALNDKEIDSKSYAFVVDRKNGNADISET